MRRLIDLVGKRFGRLTVIKYGGKNNWGKSRWLCECDCGSKVVVNSSSLNSGHTKSCGCLQKEKATISCLNRTIHGHKRVKKISKTYVSWCGIIQRCTDPHYNEYEYYGGRNIRVCKRWRNSFENFLEDMGERPEGRQIDRINNNGNYCKSNCRWVTSKTNNRNKRNNHLETYDGKTQCLTAWAEDIGIDRRTIKKRLKLGWSIEKALTTPVKKRRKK